MRQEILGAGTFGDVINVTVLGEVGVQSAGTEPPEKLTSRALVALAWLAVSEKGSHLREVAAKDVTGPDHRRPRDAYRSAINDLRRFLEKTFALHLTDQVARKLREKSEPGPMDPDQWRIATDPRSSPQARAKAVTRHILRSGSRSHIELVRDDRFLTIDYDVYRDLRDGTTMGELERAYDKGRHRLARGLTREGAEHARDLRGKKEREREAIAWGVEWHTARSEEHERELTKLCSRLMNLARNEGDLETATTWAYELTQREPWSKQVERDLIECLLEAGDETAVEAEIRRFEQRLIEAGLSTDGQLDELKSIALQSRRSVVQSDQAPLPELASKQRDQALVGRKAILIEISRQYLLARSERRRLVLVSGESGIGKTAITLALARRLHDVGADVLYGAASHSGDEPVTVALQEYFRNQPIAILRDRVSGLEADLRPALQWIGDRLGQDVVQDAGSAAGSTRRLFDAVDELLTRMSRSRPVVLIVDNIQCATPDTLAFLRFLMSGEARGLLVVCAYPTPKPRSDMWSYVRQLKRRCRPYHIQLERLSPEDTSLMAAANIGRDLTDQEAERVWRQSHGVPLRIVQAAQRLGNVEDSRANDGGMLPTVLTASTDERLWKLVALLGAAPCPLSADVLSEAGALTPDEVRSLLEPLVQDGAVNINRGAYEYRSDLDRQDIEEAASGKLSAEIRRELCHALASTLMREDVHPRQIARLFGAGGDREQVRIWTNRAAKQAEGLLAHRQAIVDYRTELEAASGGDGCEPLLQLGKLLWDIGEFADARRQFLRAAELAEEHDLPEALADAALGYAGRLGFQGASADGKLVTLLQHALRALDDRNPARRATLLATLAQARMFVGAIEHKGSEEDPANLSREAVRIADELGNDYVAADVRSRIAWAVWTPDNLEEMVALSDDLLERTDALPDRPELLMESLILRIALGVQRGERDLVTTNIKHCDELAQRLQQPHYTALVKIMLGMLALLEGPAKGEGLVLEALETATREQHPSIMQLFAGQILHVRYLQGRMAELQAASRDLTDYYHYLVAWRAGRARIYVDAGRTEEAAADLAHLTKDCCAAVPRDMFWIVVMDHACRVYTELGRTSLHSGSRAALLESNGSLARGEESFDQHELPRQLYEMLLPYAGQFVVAAGAAAVYGTVSYSLGLMAASMGKLEDARRHFEDEVATTVAFGAHPAAAQAKVELAYALLECGDRSDLPEVVDLLQQALATARSLELAGTAARVLNPAVFAEATADALGEPELAEKAAAIYQGALALAPSIPRPAPTMAQRAIKTVVRPSSRGLRWMISKKTPQQLDTRFAALHSGVFKTMARLYQPEHSFGFTGELQFDLDRLDRLDTITWTVEVHADHAVARSGPAENPKVALSMDVPTFVKLFALEQNGVCAWVEGRLLVTKGDPTLAARLIEMFSGTAPFAGIK